MIHVANNSDGALVPIQNTGKQLTIFAGTGRVIWGPGPNGFAVGYLHFSESHPKAARILALPPLFFFHIATVLFA